MELIVKPINQNIEIDNDRFELFIVETVKDIDGNEVQIPKSLGVFSKQDLQNQKASYEREIEEIDKKLNAINAL